MRQTIIIIIFFLPGFLFSQSRVEVDLTGRIDTASYARESVSFIVQGSDTTRVLSNYIGDRLSNQIFIPLKSPDEELQEINELIEAIKYDIESYAIQIRLLRARLVQLEKDKLFNIARKNKRER